MKSDYYRAIYWFLWMLFNIAMAVFYHNVLEASIFWVSTWVWAGGVSNAMLIYSLIRARLN